MSKVISLTKKEELKEILLSNKFVVTDFYADWCGPCKALAPLIEELSTIMTDIIFVKIDVDKFKNISEQYGISAIPTLVYFKEGQEQPDRTFGFISKPKLIVNLNNLKNEK